VTKPVAAFVPVLIYTVTMYHKTTLPLTTMRTTLGCLNSATWKGADPGYVMYLGGKSDRKIVASVGTTIYQDWTISHKFAIANRDLRTEWNETTGAFQQIINAAGSTFKFTMADFSALGVPTT
jgi:hypothetical protein